MNARTASPPPTGVNRYYDPTTGNFTTLDPLVALTEEPYGYVGGNPANYTDPTGLWCALGKNPNGSCRGSGVVETVKETASDGWDTTGGKAVSWAHDKITDPHFMINVATSLATVIFVASCTGFSGGAAVAACVASGIALNTAISGTGHLLADKFSGGGEGYSAVRAYGEGFFSSLTGAACRFYLGAGCLLALIKPSPSVRASGAFLLGYKGVMQWFVGTQEHLFNDC